jgi:hypothetical protein
MATITHKRGDSLELECKLVKDDVAIDITNFTITSQLRDSTDTLITDTNFNGSFTVTKTNPTTGVFKITATATETSEWPLRKAICDVQFVEADGDTTSSETFNIDIVRDVTR